MKDRRISDTASSVIILRNGRPWKLARVASQSSSSILLEGGREYCPSTGRRKDAGATSEREQITDVAPEYLAYLDIRQFFSEAQWARFCRAQLTTEDVMRLARAVREIDSILQ